MTTPALSSNPPLLSSLLKWTKAGVLLCGLSTVLPVHAEGEHRWEKQRPQWRQQLEIFQELQPKLKKEDRKLYEQVYPLLNASPQQAINLISSTEAQQRSPIFDFWLGNLLMGQDRIEEAQNALKLCLDKFPRFKEAHRSLMSLYALRGQWPQAQQQALKVIDMGGADGALYGILAYSHYQSSHFQSALSSYRMARVFDHDNDQYRRGELFCLVQLQKHHEVISASTELLKEKTNDRNLWLMQVKALMELQRPLEAISILEILLHKNLARPSDEKLLGQLYFNQNAHASAVEMFSRAMAAKLSLEHFIQPLQALVAMNKTTLAEKLIQSAQRHYPASSLNGNEHWKITEVQHLLNTGKEERAEAECRRLLETFPMNENALMALARHLSLKGNIDEAKFFLERAAKLQGTQVQAWRELGRLAWKDGQAAEAVTWLNKVLDVQPSVELQEIVARLQDRI
jgi:tetratricopeptide (TPR) repeat protein